MTLGTENTQELGIVVQHVKLPVVKLPVVALASHI